MSDWPKGPTAWIDDRRLFVSVPFTWNLNDVRTSVSQRSFLWDHATVGGPAIKLSRGFEKPFRWPDDVTVDYGDMDGVLHRGESVGNADFCGGVRTLVDSVACRESNLSSVNWTFIKSRQSFVTTTFWPVLKSTGNTSTRISTQSAKTGRR